MNKCVRIAILTNPEGGGGMTKVILNLLNGLVAYGFSPDLVLDWAEGRPYLSEIPQGVRVINLKTKIGYGTKSALKLVLPLVRYLQQEKPTLLLSHLVFTNGIVAIARTLAKVPTSLVLVEHLPLLNPKSGWQPPQSQLLRLLRHWLYSSADAVVAVSQGMAQTLEEYLILKSGTVQVIHNPVVDESLLHHAQATLDHPWFQPQQPPVFLAVGRLTGQKDFSTLIQAFARLREQRLARLIILGEGELRPKLVDLVRQLNLEADISLPGFVTNPYCYMSRAAAFVLSSRWEGLPTVLIEAIACGCQVVATDCPHGPSEILAAGKYGRLVAVGDASALAEAMQQAIDFPIEISELRHRAEDFRIDRSVSEYLRLAGI
jgi:glycosyltransferase involved in cell wall biosynthesis